MNRAVALIAVSLSLLGGTSPATSQELAPPEAALARWVDAHADEATALLEKFGPSILARP